MRKALGQDKPFKQPGAKAAPPSKKAGKDAGSDDDSSNDDAPTCGAASAHKGWEKDCPSGYSCDFGQGFAPNTYHEMANYRAGLRACAEGGKTKLPACLVAALTAS